MFFCTLLVSGSAMHGRQENDGLIRFLGRVKSSYGSASSRIYEGHVINKTGLMSFLLGHRRRVIYASNQMQPDCIESLKGFIVQRFLYSFRRCYKTPLLYCTLSWEKQPTVIAALILRLPHNITKSVSDLYGVFDTQKREICPQTHVLCYRASHISHGDFTHQYAPSFIKDNGGTRFDINGNPRAMLQLQLPFHNVKLLPHYTPLPFHDARLPIYGFETIRSTRYSEFGFVGLPRNENKGEETNNDEPPFGPFEGCVPPWRVAIGFCGMCLGVLVIIRSNRRIYFLWGALFILSGSLIWLTGHYDCKEGNSRNHNQAHHELSQGRLHAAFFDQNTGSIPTHGFHE